MSNTPRGADEPGQLPPPLPPDLLEQPRPVQVLFCYAGTGTAIFRAWKPGDVARCELCPACCSADGRTCLIGIGLRVPPEQVEMYRVPPGARMTRPDGSPVAGPTPGR